MRAIWLSIAAFWAAAALPAQTLTPAYEVAVIKPNNTGSGNSSSNGSKGQVIFTNLTLKNLIAQAYEVQPFRVTGPDWMETLRFDISAKFPPDTKREDRPQLLRALLEERFKLAPIPNRKVCPAMPSSLRKADFASSRWNPAAPVPAPKAAASKF